jgi:hypothetical protein
MKYLADKKQKYYLIAHSYFDSAIKHLIAVRYIFVKFLYLGRIIR